MRTIAFASEENHGKIRCVNRITPPPQNWSTSTSNHSFAVTEYTSRCAGLI